MLILCCYVSGRLEDRTLQALTRNFRSDELYFNTINPEDPFHYGRILDEFWRSGRDFAVVEPDIVIRVDVANAFRNCPGEYCCYPYAWKTDVGPALGCTRFRASLTSQYPNAVSDIIGQRIAWNQLDVVLMRHTLAREHGIQPHVHLPAVEHLNPEKQLLPEANPEPLMTVPHW